jgi:hypothetical protein
LGARSNIAARPKADKDRSGFLQRKFIIEAHFAGRKSLL